MPAHSGLTGASLHESKGAAAATAGQVAVADGAGSAPFGTLVNGSFATGYPVQVTGTTKAAVASGTTLIPGDNSIPQNDEGTEVMTHAHTPRSSTNKLLITVNALVSHNEPCTVCVALFKDATAAALAASGVYIRGDDTPMDASAVSFQHIMTAGTTSEITFKVRIGGNVAGTAVLNGDVGATRLYGGVAASSITVTEYKAS